VFTNDVESNKLTKKICHNTLFSPQVVFEAVRGNGYHGDIALDDISFTNAACGVQPSDAATVAQMSTFFPSAGTATPPTGSSFIVVEINDLFQLFCSA